ncbi:MAG TPA: phosphoglucosamine mutase [Clostridia bacterium]|nr:MAG: Phosphoglucosamine mutase [Firmicutes bacterium ADurb.Bin146]HOD93801.1 phosphoglucosamine mutase [Clostridia bacterium]
MGKIFGTDGARGIANKELTVSLAFNLGKAGAFVLAGESNHLPKILIGADTRISSDMLMSATEAGLCAMGANVIRAGVVTTPAVAYLTKLYSCDAGIVISASHNSYEYNGIKFFNRDGFKLPDETEDQIERIITGEGGGSIKTHDAIGRIYKEVQCIKAYSDFLLGQCSSNISKLKVLLDCANGAASEIAPDVFKKAGCNISHIYSQPNGLNINKDCGSTHISNLANEVVKGGFDIGFAYDGDADRLLAVSEKGEIIDGDVLMSALTLFLKNKGLLYKDTLVVTEMSNMGVDVFGKKNSVKIVRTKVGDRYVVEEMQKSGYAIGGEQSGHIILLPFSTTGDGILASLKIAQILAENKLKASNFFEIMKPLPQVLINVRINNEMKTELKNDNEIQTLYRKVTDELDGNGRIVLRVSGTEPVIRVMIEGEDLELIENRAKLIADKIKQKLN